MLGRIGNFHDVDVYLIPELPYFLYWGNEGLVLATTSSHDDFRWGVYTYFQLRFSPYFRYFGDDLRYFFHGLTIYL